MKGYAIDNQRNTMPTIFIQKGYKINNLGKKIRKIENVLSLLPICRKDNMLETREIHRIAYKTTKISGFASFFPYQQIQKS